MQKMLHPAQGGLKGQSRTQRTWEPSNQAGAGVSCPLLSQRQELREV